MQNNQEQLKLWKEFEWTWEEYDVLKYFDRYDQKLLLLTKHALTNETKQTNASGQSYAKISTTKLSLEVQEDNHCRSHAQIMD